MVDPREIELLIKIAPHRAMLLHQRHEALVLGVDSKIRQAHLGSFSHMALQGDHENQWFASTKIHPKNDFPSIVFFGLAASVPSLKS